MSTLLARFYQTSTLIALFSSISAGDRRSVRDPSSSRPLRRRHVLFHSSHQSFVVNDSKAAGVDAHDLVPSLLAAALLDNPHFKLVNVGEHCDRSFLL